MSSKRRLVPGTKSSKLYGQIDRFRGNAIEDAYTVEQYIKSSLRSQQRKLQRNKNEKVTQIKRLENTETIKWAYDYLVAIIRKMNILILDYRDNHCNKNNYPAMRIPEKLITGKDQDANQDLIFSAKVGSELVNLSAIDYMVFTLNTALTALPIARKRYDKRGDDKELLNVIKEQIRRLARIFAFGFYVMPNVFDDFEDATKITNQFLRFVSKYKLAHSDDMIIPKNLKRPKI